MSEQNAHKHSFQAEIGSAITFSDAFTVFQSLTFSYVN